MKIKIAEKHQGERLDKFLVAKLPELSRTEIQKAIEAKKVLVNKKIVSKHYFLNTDDCIDIAEKIEPKKTITKLDPNDKIKFEVIFENTNYLVINKPSNLIIHPGNTHPEQDTLINGVLAKYPDIVGVGESILRPGVVHRLDKEVSGLLVMARTQPAYLNLKQQFIDRKIYKEYLALVHGEVLKQNDTINLSIGRSKSNGYKMAAQTDGSGKEAITEYEVIKQYNNYALLKVIIHTGRTHQIRVHLNAVGYPVVGDTVYKPRSLKSNADLDRIFLHSHILKFTDLEGKELVFEQEMPEKLTNFLDNLA